MSIHACRPSRARLGHDFDPGSGWCIHGCGVRDDGLVIATRTARTIAPPDVIDVTEPRRGGHT